VGAPLPNCQVRAMSANGAKHSNRTESDGRHVVSGLPGGRISLTAMMDGKHLSHVAARDVQVATNATVENVDFEVEAGTLEGIVRYANGDPAPSATVFVNHPDGRTSLETSDGDGRFTVYALDPDAEYYLDAREGKNYSTTLGPFIP